jgi:WD40 repeat protein
VGVDQHVRCVRRQLFDGLESRWHEIVRLSLSLSLLLSFLSSEKADSRASFDSAVASQDGVVSVWDVRSSRCVKQVRGHCQGLEAPARG